MANLYIYYKPTAAQSYRIRWKRSTDATYPPTQSREQLKAPGTWNNILVTIPDTDTDWNFEVVPICSGSPGFPYYGVVRAVCKKVTFTAGYEHCICPPVSAITMTSN